MDCIIKYKNKKNKCECYCKVLSECSKCNNGENRSGERCIVEIGAYCTCRTCGRAIKVDK